MNTSATVSAFGNYVNHVELMRAMGPLEGGQEIEIRADDRAFPADVKAWCSKTGHVLIEITQNGEAFTARVKKKPTK